MNFNRTQYNAAVQYTEKNLYRLKLNNAKALAVMVMAALATIVYLVITLMLPKF